MKSRFFSKALLNLYFWPMFILVTAFGLVLAPFIVISIILFTRRKTDYALRWAIAVYGWVLVRAVPFFSRVQVISRYGKLPDTAIFAANHTSVIDPYLFGALMVNACFITSWPFKIPVYGPLMHLAGYISSGEGWENIYLRASEFLKSGTSLIFWPEGHRSRDGKLGDFKNGAFALSAQTGFPIVPVCILGAAKFMSPGSRILTPSKVRIVILEPVYPEGESGSDIRAMRNKVKSVIQETLMEYA
ncbi:MAG: lysophospholipid acyltransferase family protein [Brevinematales bacterium]|jgi:1-acyl-sn-glycerol-3-phosphate acyltransferase